MRIVRDFGALIVPNPEKPCSWNHLVPGPRNHNWDRRVAALWNYRDLSGAETRKEDNLGTLWLNQYQMGKQEEALNSAWE